MSKLDAFTEGYIECLLWSSTYGEEGTPVDDDFGPEDISPEAMAEIVQDCTDFQAANADDLNAYASERSVRPGESVDAYAGHDFCLTRNHHGAGFWDRGLGELGDRLTKASHAYGSMDIYPGDDGKLYV